MTRQGQVLAGHHELGPLIGAGGLRVTLGLRPYGTVTTSVSSAHRATTDSTARCSSATCSDHSPSLCVATFLIPAKAPCARRWSPSWRDLHVLLDLSPGR